MILKFTWFAVIILSCAIIVEPLEISEIMYNPEGQDYLYEFIELYSENQTDISNFVFQGINLEFPSNVSFEGIIILARSKEGFFERYNFTPDFIFKESLKNSGEEIVIYKNQTIILNVSYQDSAPEGFSLEFNQTDYVVGENLHGSPGKIYNSSLKREIELETETELINQTNELSCDPKLSFNFDKDIYESGDTVYFTPALEGVPENSKFEINYYVSDSFENVVKKELTTKNLEQKRYTPKISQRDVIHYLHTKFTIDCQEKSFNKLFPIVIRNNKNYSFSVKNIPSSIKYGETLSLSLEILADSSNENVSVILNNIFDFSFSIKGYFNGEMMFKIPEECTAKTFTGNTRLILKYKESVVEKEIRVLPSKKCNLPGIRRVYRLARDLVPGKNISIYVSFDLKDITENDSLHLFHDSKHYSQKLASEISPIHFPIQLKSGNNSFKVELRRDHEIIDIDGLNLFVEPNDKQITTNHSKSGQKGGEMFKNEIGLSDNNKKESKIPKIPKMYYLIFGVSVIGNLMLLWKS